ncbi:hypothetical protein G6F65_011420 [Rhizopus arrhizus]|nr:hypothetical protein G6F65_011420 [Rhizopus arrhizus]
MPPRDLSLPDAPSLSSFQLVACVLQAIWTCRWQFLFHDTPFTANYVFACAERLINRFDSIVAPRKSRPLSIVSASSEDSVDLDELINVNFTTSMEEETDLNNLSSLELDDSKEDFWKVDNIYVPPVGTFNKTTYNKDSNESKKSYLYQKGNNKSFMNTPKVSSSTTAHYDTPTYSSSINIYAQTLSGSPKPSISFQNKRPLSFYSEIDMHSQTVVPHHQYHRPARPTESTSTSSFDSQSTEASVLSRTTLPITQSTVRRRQEQYGLLSSTPENTSKLASRSFSSSHSNVSRRASHIPAPSSTVNKSRQSIIPQLTQSTTLSKQPRSVSRMSQVPKRASHIPTLPPRSTTSLGISSLCSDTTASSSNLLSKPSSSLTRSKTSHLISNTTKTTSLRVPNSRSIHQF